MQNSGDKKKQHKLESIQALRGVAILLVLLIHAKRYEAFYAGNILPQVLGAGQSGVDLFFVISGFIMITITRGSFGRGSAKPIQFLGKRICRIYPLYWFYTLLLLLPYIIKPSFIHSTEMGRHVDLLGSLTLYPTGVRTIIWQSWSLSLEIYFYLVFAVILLFEEKMLPKILSAWALLVIIGYVLKNRFFYDFVSPGLDLIINPMTLEFIGGAFIALLVWEKERRSAPVLLVVGAIGLILSAFIQSDPNQHLRVLLFGAPSLLILAGSILCELAGSFQFNKWLVFIGDISYSVYLTHIMVYSICGRFWPSSWQPGVGKSLLFCLLLGSFALAWGAISYRFIEKPILQFCHKRLLHDPRA